MFVKNKIGQAMNNIIVKVPLLNFEVGPQVSLLNFEGGPRSHF